jgi:Protein of unknown function (DUF1573)
MHFMWKRSLAAFGLTAALISEQHPAMAGEPGQPSLSTADTAAAAPALGVPANTGPQIQFDDPAYNFGRIGAGEPVKHTFVFTNTGDAQLVISNVTPGCGCTTAGAWTKEVEPGKTGKIPIQVNTSAFNGPIGKSVTVTCNDKAHARVTLQISGTVWKPFDVNPQNVVLHVPAESSSEATMKVRIVNNTEQLVTLSEPECTNRAFSAELKTVRPGKEFELVVKAAPPFKSGTVQGAIALKTSSMEVPVLNVSVLAMMQAAVEAMPGQIILPSGPLGNDTTMAITVRNNGTNVLSLSNAVVNATGVETKIREVQPGKQFAVSIVFPKGFEAAPGQRIALSLESSHPQFKVITVPILQRPGPAAMRHRPMPPLPNPMAQPPVKTSANKAAPPASGAN